MKEFQNPDGIANYIKLKETEKKLEQGWTLHIYYDKRRKTYVVEETEFED